MMAATARVCTTREDERSPTTTTSAVRVAGVGRAASGSSLPGVSHRPLPARAPRESSRAACRGRPRRLPACVHSPSSRRIKGTSHWPGVSSSRSVPRQGRSVVRRTGVGSRVGATKIANRSNLRFAGAAWHSSGWRGKTSASAMSRRTSGRHPHRAPPGGAGPHGVLSPPPLTKRTQSSKPRPTGLIETRSLGHGASGSTPRRAAERRGR